MHCRNYLLAAPDMTCKSYRIEIADIDDDSYRMLSCCLDHIDTMPQAPINSSNQPCG